MSTKNLTRRSLTSVPRKRQAAAVTAVASVDAFQEAVSEFTNSTSSFMATLTECQTKRATKGPTRKQGLSSTRIAAKPRQVSPAVEDDSPAVGLDAVNPGPVASGPVARTWNWLHTQYSALAKKGSEVSAITLFKRPSAAPVQGRKTPTRRPLEMRGKSSSALKRVSKPEPPAQPAPNAMSRAFNWLQTKYTMGNTKRLRVAENVSLGEKRFVALVTVDGRELLIGGGSTNVSLLANLNPGMQSIGIPQLDVAVGAE